MWLLTSGTKNVADVDVPEALGTAAILGTHIWVGAKYAAGLFNADDVFVGNVSAQVRPLLATNFEGFLEPTGDLSKVFIKVLSNGDGVNWALYGGD